jgi:hyperosmotically inducible protein
MDDLVITGTIKTKLAEDQTIDSMGINVDTTNGVVTLSGLVNSNDQKQQAELLASGIEGVQEVINELELNPNK